MVSVPLSLIVQLFDKSMRGYFLRFKISGCVLTVIIRSSVIVRSFQQYITLPTVTYRLQGLDESTDKPPDTSLRLFSPTAFTSQWNSLPVCTSVRITLAFIPGRISSSPINPPTPSSCMRDWITVSILLIFVALSSYLLSILRLIASEASIHEVMVSTMSDTFSILSTSCWLDASTSCIAVSISRIWLPSLWESFVIFSTFSPVCITFSRVSWMRRSVSSMDEVIFPEISSSRESASLI